MAAPFWSACFDTIRLWCRVASLPSIEFSQFWWEYPIVDAASTVYRSGIASNYYIGKRAADSSKLGETLSDEEESIVDKLAVCSQFVLTKIIDEIEQISADSSFDAAKIDCTIATESAVAVEEFFKTCSPEVALEANSTVHF